LRLIWKGFKEFNLVGTQGKRLIDVSNGFPNGFAPFPTCFAVGKVIPYNGIPLFCLGFCELIERLCFAASCAFFFHVIFYLINDFSKKDAQRYDLNKYKTI